MQRVGRQRRRGDLAGCAVRRLEVRGPGQHVGPHVGRQVDRRAARVRHQQRRPRRPPLVLAVGLHHQGAGVRKLAAQQQAVAPAGERVVEYGVGEGELVCLPGRVLRVARVAAGLAEAHVGRHAPGAADVRHHALEHDPVRRILVEAEVKVVAGEASGLGNAEQDRPGNGGSALRGQRVGSAVFAAQEARDVAGHGEAHPEHRRVACRVDQLVEGAGVEAGGGAGDLHVRVVDRAGRQPGRLLPRVRPGGADRKVERRRGSELPGRRHQGRAGGVVEHELLAHPPGHAGQDGRLHRELPRRRRDIALPADPDQGGAPAVKEAVARVTRLLGRGGTWLGRVVEQLGRELAAAVGNVDQHGAAGGSRVGRGEDYHVGRRLDLAVGIAGRSGDVGDDRVVRIGRVERDRSAGGDPAVGTRFAELASGEGRRILGQLETRDLRERG